VSSSHLQYVYFQGDTKLVLQNHSGLESLGAINIAKVPKWELPPDLIVRGPDRICHVERSRDPSEAKVAAQSKHPYPKSILACRRHFLNARAYVVSGKLKMFIGKGRGQDQKAITLTIKRKMRQR